jgi:hypothetical protein
MHTLTEALNHTVAGWSAQPEIVERARLMRGHAENGNLLRAEEYALEIEALQIAENQRYGIKPREMPVWAADEWRIGYTAWARMLNHGWMCPRTVWAAEGWTAENVAAEALRVSPLLVITAADMIAPAHAAEVAA